MAEGGCAGKSIHPLHASSGSSKDDTHSKSFNDADGNFSLVCVVFLAVRTDTALHFVDHTPHTMFCFDMLQGIMHVCNELCHVLTSLFVSALLSVDLCCTTPSSFAQRQVGMQS